MNLKVFLSLTILIIFSNMADAQNIEIQGHRGCRGYYPENTIEGFMAAINQGVHTLEMDVVISKDHEIIISHEPFFNHEISKLPDGSEFEKNDEKYEIF